MNYTKYNRIQKEINICKIKHDKKQMEYERFIDRKMFCTNKFKNTYSTAVYNCLPKPRYPTSTTCFSPSLHYS